MFFHNENTTYKQLDLCIRLVRVMRDKGYTKLVVSELRTTRNVWSAALPQAKSEVTGWSAQMYSAFVGVRCSWPGWNALRSVPFN